MVHFVLLYIFVSGGFKVFIEGSGQYQLGNAAMSFREQGETGQVPCLLPSLNNSNFFVANNTKF
jgi:hypothetical protein